MENSIGNSLLAIQKRNRLGKNSYYIKPDYWDKYILNCQFEAILGAAKEVFEGIDYQELEELIDVEQLMVVGNELLALTYNKSPKEIIEVINSKFLVQY